MKYLFVVFFAVLLFGCENLNTEIKHIENEIPQKEDTVAETVQNDVYKIIRENSAVTVSNEDIYFFSHNLDYLDLYRFDAKSLSLLEFNDFIFVNRWGGSVSFIEQQQLYLVSSGVAFSGLEKDIATNATITTSDLNGDNKKTISFDENQTIENNVMVFDNQNLYFIVNNYSKTTYMPTQTVLSRLDIETMKVQEIAVLQSFDETTVFSEPDAYNNVSVVGTYYDGIILSTSTVSETSYSVKISLYSLSSNKIIETTLEFGSEKYAYPYLVDKNGVFYYYDFSNNTLNSYDITTEQNITFDIDMTQGQDEMSVELQGLYDGNIHYRISDDTESQLYAVNLKTEEITKLTLTYEYNFDTVNVRIVQETEQDFIVVSGYQKKYVELKATTGEYMVFHNKSIYTYSLINKEDFYNNQPNYRVVDIELF